MLAKPTAEARPLKLLVLAAKFPPRGVEKAPPAKAVGARLKPPPRLT